LWTVFFYSWLPQVYVLTFFSILTRPKQVHQQSMRDMEENQRQAASLDFNDSDVRHSDSKPAEEVFVSSSALSESIASSQVDPHSYSASTAIPSLSSGQTTAVGSGIRCRACGVHNKVDWTDPRRSSWKRDDTMMGFHAALMELNESYDELHLPGTQEKMEERMTAGNDRRHSAM
jgi:hypothetical protein